MGQIIKHYVLPTDPLTLDELTINSHEKDIMADRLIHLMSNQFIGCPLIRPVVPVDPSQRDLDLLHSLTISAAHNCFALNHFLPQPIPSATFQLANSAWRRSRLLLDQMETDIHNDDISLYFDETSDLPNLPGAYSFSDYLRLDHRLAELLRNDPPARFHFALSPDSDESTSGLEIFGSSGGRMTIPACVNATFAATPTRSIENVILDFASSDYLDIIDKLIQGPEPRFDRPMRSTECPPDCQPAAHRGRFPIRLLVSIGDHTPFTTFSVDPPETFPSKKLAVSNAIRVFINMYPEFQLIAPGNHGVAILNRD
jgi:hypothetical protein